MRNSTKSLGSKQLEALFDRLFYCPSCTTWRSSTATRNLASQHKLLRRNASTWTSSTAVNATKQVPTRLGPLYESLTRVRRDASSHVNTSRLQLALQGLESRSPTIRLAVLGLNVPDTARRLVRLLTADPLEEQGRWEEQLIHGKDDYSRGLIIRYGNDGAPATPRPRNSVPVLHIPAPILERHNIEILISSVNSSPADGSLRNATIPSDTFLAPVIGTPTSFDGRQTIISQPVHRCLLVTKGLDELIAASQLLAATKFTSEKDKSSIHLAVNLDEGGLSGPETNVHSIDVERAEQGIAAIRHSVSQAVEYEHKWTASGVTKVSHWISLSVTEVSQKTSLASPIESLITAVLDSAGANVEAAKRRCQRNAAGNSLSSTTRISLDTAINEFSRSAHSELQFGLASAWSSRNWRKLAWYKLFWRVDDVGLIVADLIVNAWLPKTERAVYELSGRLIQAGISPVMIAESKDTVHDQSLLDSTIQQRDQKQPSSIPSPIPELAMSISSPSPSSSSTTPRTLTFASLTSRPTPTQPVITNPRGSTPEVKIQPIPQPESLTTQISSHRTKHIATATTNLTTTAQQLLLRTLSLTGLTAGLSALTYTSLPSTSLYEAGTIAAVGSILALYKLQGDWMRATRKVEETLYAEGRDMIIDITNAMRSQVNMSSEVRFDPVEEDQLNRAQKAISQARTELEALALAPAPAPAPAPATSSTNGTKTETGTGTPARK